MLSKKIKGIIRLFRPDLSLASGVCLLTGQVLAAGRLPAWRTGVLGFLCIFALSGTALILNDYFDYEVDKVNAPDRPLPSGAVSRTEALILTGLTVGVGLAAALGLGWPSLLLSMVLLVIGVLYNWRLKESGLPGNLMVSTSVALSFILGAVTVGSPWNRVVWIFSLMAFLLDLGEEIAGDAMDMEGDKKRQSHSLALVRGKSFALRVSLTLWSLMVVLSLIPALWGWLGTNYFLMILLTDGLTLFFSARLWRSRTPEEGRQAMRGIYLGATLAIAAFMVGQLLR